ncbi:hypothetical protein [Flavobacterium sp. LS1R10]|uniref:hypothetical protein n=1 Tax=Flavobacterium sp. LS1R10 TaxID=2497482 RepID=UPI000F845A74|nr:hypothetical protein [Flavobacterium sp. LS1R10]RTY74321.1 hypothetical protein EKL96_09695 [Flavobacterium sp. LS1R10]
MKNYLKFIFAVFGITIATFGSITDATAKIAPIMDGCDNSSRTCGTTPDGATITGNCTAMQSE